MQFGRQPSADLLPLYRTLTTESKRYKRNETKAAWSSDEEGSWAQSEGVGCWKVLECSWRQAEFRPETLSHQRSKGTTPGSPYCSGILNRAACCMCLKRKCYGRAIPS